MPSIAPPAWFTAGQPHVWLPYAQMKTTAPPLPVAHAHGVRLVLEDGRELIDGVASWWTACHGYAHPAIAQAVRAQLETMPHVMFGGLAHQPAYDLARHLAALLPDGLDHVFFSDSGSVAVEVAMKMALQFWLNQGVRGRTRFLAFRGGYHGDTQATMAVCDPEEGMHRAFAGVLTRQYVVALPRDAASLARLHATLDRHGRKLAGMIVEPLVQGAGGMVFHPPQTLRWLREAADAHGLPLIADEVFTGFARTGSLFACVQAGIVPDIMVLSKALTGGTMGLGATIASRRIFEAFWSDDPAQALMHGPTFMANPLACAAALASLDLFARHDRPAQARAIGAAMATGLAPCAELPWVRDVRVLGAIGVVELHATPDIAALQRQFLAAGLFVRPFRNIVYLTPALTIGADDLARLIQGMRAVLGAQRPD